MKEKSSGLKTSQQGAQNASQTPAAGPDGVSIVPPAYGIESLDRALAEAAPESGASIQIKAAPSAAGGDPGSRPPNRTGLPDALKTGVASLSGLALDDVRVHYNSPKPAQLQALAYTQGSEIHVGPGQERHVPHEAWHVVQQKQGRVRATLQAKGVAINDDTDLEREADRMGETAARQQITSNAPPGQLRAVPFPRLISSNHPPIQRALVKDKDILDSKGNTNFSWTSFKGRRDTSQSTQPGTETGRGAYLENGDKFQTSVTWQPVHAQTGEGTKMEAIIGPDHKLGSSPGVEGIKSRVNAFATLSGEKYISGHLLNENLGGSGNDARNLTAIPQTANIWEAKNIEDKVRKPVNEQGHWYYYTVEIGYDQSQRTYDNHDGTLGNYKTKFKKNPPGIAKQTRSMGIQITVDYASSLKATWYQLNTAGQRFGKKYEVTIDIDSPLEGGEYTPQDPSIKKQPNQQTRGTQAITNILPEELVLTNDSFLKVAVEARQRLLKIIRENGQLIGILQNDLKQDRTRYKKLLKDQKASIEEYEKLYRASKKLFEKMKKDNDDQEDYKQMYEKLFEENAIVLELQKNLKAELEKYKQLSQDQNLQIEQERRLQLHYIRRVERRDKSLENVQNTVLEREKEITNLNQSLQEKDRIIEELRQQLALLEQPQNKKRKFEEVLNPSSGKSSKKRKLTEDEPSENLTTLYEQLDNHQDEFPGISEDRVNSIYGQSSSVNHFVSLYLGESTPIWKPKYFPNQSFNQYRQSNLQRKNWWDKEWSLLDEIYQEKRKDE